MSDLKMPENTTLSHLPLLVKIFAVLVGAVFALTLTGDIDSKGRLHLSFGVLIKFTFSAFLGFLGGDFLITYWGLQEWSYTAHGLIMMMVSIFGMLIVGVVYQTIKLTAKDKTVSELVAEVKEVFRALFK